MSRWGIISGITLAIFFNSLQLSAYPSSIVFVPTGDSRKLGDVGVFIYTSTDYDPGSGPGVNWYGGNIGILPEFKYGDTGTGFGGLEIGVDAISPYNYPGDSPTIKSIINFKAQVLTETSSLPHVSIGAIDLAYLKPYRGANITYISLTKRLSMQKDYGRITFGLGDSFVNDPALFTATAPFQNTNMLLLGGYESPTFGPISFGLDYFGGTSELSSTNLALNYAPISGGTISIGGFFSNNRSNPATTYDGLFAILSLNWNLKNKQN
jgi:hypothetical protein